MANCLYLHGSYITKFDFMNYAFAKAGNCMVVKSSVLEDCLEPTMQTISKKTCLQNSGIKSDGIVS